MTFHRFFDVAAIVLGVASIVIGQAAGACSLLVDNVIGELPKLCVKICTDS